jgi:hypothetical protein
MVADGNGLSSGATIGRSASSTYLQAAWVYCCRVRCWVAASVVPNYSNLLTTVRAGL